MKCSKRDAQTKTRKNHPIRMTLFMILSLCASTVFIIPALAQLKMFRCSVNFDKDFYRPGETVTMYGTVTSNDEPVEGVKVVVDVKDFGLSGLGAVTDSDGNWTLSFQVPDDQEFGTWQVEVSVDYEGNSITMLDLLQVGEDGEVDEIETLRARIAELNAEKMELEAENQVLQDQIQELEEENQRLRETSSGVSFGTVALALAVALALSVVVGLAVKKLLKRSREVI